MSFDPMPEDRPPAPWKGMFKRFALAAVLLIVVSAGTTATVALNKVSSIASEVFPKVNQISAPKSVVTPVYSGEPQTFLILGSDRRPKSKDIEDRSNPPHSDTMLLVRFDPEQEQTSVLSIPRDLMVNIRTSTGQYYPAEKINAAYTIGNHIGGVRGGMLLAAETIEHEVFPGLKLNGIVDLSFQGFIRVVDTLGCAYVNVDHHYYNQNIGTPETDYSSINLQPGYQKLCYENALDYVRYRHTDSDFVRVARQQDFLRDLRQQISPGNVVGQIDTVAKAVGHAVASTFHGSASELIELAKLVAFSQGKLMRQVKFKTANVDFRQNGVTYVTSTPELAQETLKEFLYGRPRLHVAGASAAQHPGHRSHHLSAPTPAALGLTATTSAGRAEAAGEAVRLPLPVLYPGLQTVQAVQRQARAYTLADQAGHSHHAYVTVWQQNGLGGYYDLEGTDWLNPPVIAHPDQTLKLGGRSYLIFSDGGHIHMVAWREQKALYWLTNTLLEDLSNAQMLAIARSAVPLR
ncbi:MAG TPA: LCP family protein [Solirubrobacteraceae bacterium]